MATKQAAQTQEKPKGEKPSFRLCVKDENNPNGKMLEISAFWKRTSAAGKEYLSGQVKENVSLKKGEFLSLFPNE